MGTWFPKVTKSKTAFKPRAETASRVLSENYGLALALPPTHRLIPEKIENLSLFPVAVFEEIFRVAPILETYRYERRYKRQLVWRSNIFRPVRIRRSASSV